MSELLDIFNLDADSLITKNAQAVAKDLEFYKPYPEEGKDLVYKSLIRFVPNPVNKRKSKIHKYYVYLTDPVSGNGFSVDCPSTVGKKSILKDLYWKLKNSNSAADQELAKKFSRKEDYYALIQIVQDKNKPELEGKIMIWKFGSKINDLIEAQLEPEYGDKVNPFDLLNGREFAIHVRKVGEWNNYDLCNFVGDKTPIKVGGRPMKATEEDMRIISKYLDENAPKNLESFDYKDWDDNLTEKVLEIIRNTVPETRMINEIISGANATKASTSKQNSSVSEDESMNSSITQDAYDEMMKTKVGKDTKPQKSASSTSAPSTLDDLYNDL